MKTWQLRIEDPSGETRIVPLQGEKQSSVTIGRHEDSQLLLRDPTAPMQAGLLWASPRGETGSPYWFRAQDAKLEASIGDIPMRESLLPEGVSLRIGETKLVLERTGAELALPDMPGGVKPWLTCSETGRKLLWTAKKSAATPLAIYLGGETGTGKEVIANLIHAWSERAAGPFVPINCGALPLALAESELFGHVKGAFTGASHQRPGALMQAHGGTLFLDEVADLPLDIQVKLLRFLEDGEIRPVGADRPSRADVRLLCATHKPLKQLVEEGKFRRDLYYRIASVAIEIECLRARPDDIELLATRFSAALHRTLSPRALLRLQAHSWPGNVRELRHAIERASGLAGPFVKVLSEEAFEFLLTPENIQGTPEIELGAAVLTLEEMERVMLIKALKLSRGNRATAAKILGVARSTLFEMLKRHRICGPKGDPTRLQFQPGARVA